MKIATIILFIAFSCLSFTAKSQFTKGQQLLGGNAAINFNSLNSESDNNPTYKTRPFILSISPRFSWVTKDNQMMGATAGVGYFYSKSFSEGSQDYQSGNSFSLSLGYFLRQYKTFSQQAGWFIEYNVNGGYGYGTSKNVYTGVENKTTYKSFGTGLLVYPGFYYKMSPRTLIEASFGGLNAGYSKVKGETSSSNQFNIGASFPTNLSLGVQFFLGNKSGK